VDVAWINGKASETTQGECGSVDSLSFVCGKAVRQGWSKQPNEWPLDKRIKALLQGTAERLGTYCCEPVARVYKGGECGTLSSTVIEISCGVVP